MTSTLAPAPAVARTEPRPAPAPRGRRLLATAVVLQPLLIAVNALFHPDVDMTGASLLAGAVEGPTRWAFVHFVAAVGALLAPATMTGLRTLVVVRSRRLAATALVLGGIGGVVLAVAFAIEATTLRLAATVLDPAAATAYAEALIATPEMIMIPVGALTTTLASMLMGIALLRDRSVPRAPTALYVAATAATIAAAPGSPIGPVAFFLVTIASAVLARHVWRGRRHETDPLGPLPATTVELPEHLAPFRLMHTAMRRDAARLVQVIADLEPGDRKRLRALGRWYGQVAAAIVHHHEIEDEHVWPALRDRRPGFAAVERRLVDEHHVLDDAMAELGASLARGAAEATPETRVRALAAARRFQQVLEDHLAAEETQALTVLGEAFSPDELERMHAEAQRSSPRSVLAFLFPWVTDGMAEAEVTALAKEVPLPLRLLFRGVWRPQYRRVSAPLRG